MKYFILVGEVSGDKHGAELTLALKAQDPQADIHCFGGDAMQAAGAVVVRHINETAFMGITEVISNLGKIRHNFAVAKESILSFTPNVVIFIDYPGFNLRMAKWAKQNKFKTAYYIPPKVWAWKENRVKKIKKYVDLLLVIFPFEVEYYKKRGIDAHYVGNPSKNTIDAYRSAHPFDKSDKPILAVFPGSRKQEIDRMMDILKDATDLLSRKYHIVIAGIRTLGEQVYPSRYEIVYDDSFSVLHRADLALVKSGTSTLEAALFEVPQVVCYRTSGLTYTLAKAFVKIRFISLPNILLNKALLPELIQNDMNVDNICKHLVDLYNDPSDQLKGYAELQNQLGSDDASDNAARAIRELARIDK